MKIVNCKLKIAKAAIALLSAVFLIFILFPMSPVYAANCGLPADNPATPENDTQPCAGLVPCTGIDCSLCDLLSLGQNVFNFVVITLVPVVAVVLIVWSGFVILTAGGNPANVAKGRKMITNTVIGIVIVYTAYLLASFVIRGIAGTSSVANSSFQGNQFVVQCTGGEIEDVASKLLQGGALEIGEEIPESDTELAPEVGAERSDFELGGDGSVEVVIKTKTGVNMDDVDEAVKESLRKAVVDARSNNLELIVADGFRGLEEQESLVEQNCEDPDADRCVPKPGRNLTCVPRDTDGNGGVDGSNCRHTTGQAVDVWSYARIGGDKCCQGQATQIMKSNGFCVLKGESWHFELESNLQNQGDRIKAFNC